MIAYLCTDNQDVHFDKISWKNTWCLSHDLEEAKKLKNPGGLVFKVDMDEKDVIQAVLACMHGNSYAVKVNILETYQ